MNIEKKLVAYLSWGLLVLILLMSGCGDPVKKDFSSYLNDLQKTNASISSSPITAEFARCSQTRDVSSKGYISSYTGTVFNMAKDEEKVVQILKCHSDYYSMRAAQYENILPKSPDVENIHKKIIASNKAFSNAYDEIIRLLNTDTIFQVTFDKNGELRWKKPIERKDDDASINKYFDEANKLSDDYNRDLRIMANKYKMSSRLDKILNPQSLEPKQDVPQKSDSAKAGGAEDISDTISYSGTLELGAKSSKLNCYHGESGDLLVIHFDTKSDIGKKILSVCKNNELCEITGNIRWLDANETHTEGASADAQIVSLKSVKKLDKLPEVEEPE